MFRLISRIFILKQVWDFFSNRRRSRAARY
jgi:hypothetical protein